MAVITSYWVIDSVMILTITSMLAAYLFMTRKFNYWKKRGVTEIKPLPFFGNMADCMLQKQSPGFLMKDLYNQSKGLPYIGIYVFDKPCLLIRDREILKDILVKEFNIFPNHNFKSSAHDQLGNSSLFAIKNPTWKLLRNKLTPIFTSGKLKTMFNLLMETTVNLDSYFDKLNLDDKGKVIEVRNLFGNLTTDMISSTAYGLDVNSVNNPECEFRQQGRKIFEFDFFRGMEIFMIFFYPDISRFINLNFFGKKTSVFLREVFWDTINHRMKSGQKRGDLIDTLIDLRKEYSGQDLGNFKFDGDDLVAQAAIFFTGGFETSSSAMSFTLYELAKNPDIQNRVRKEIFDTINKNEGKLTYEMVHSMPYLDMVVFETLRMYPILTVFDRESIMPYKIPNSDLVIEKDTPIYISVLGLHYDPEYFPDPEKYDPERFNEENKHKIPPFAYIPFGEGPRKCIGSRLGLMQVKLGLIKLLYRCEVTPCDKTLIPMVLDPKTSIAQPLNGTIYLKVRKIEASVK